MFSQLQKYDYFHTFKTFILSKLQNISLTKLYYSIGEVAKIFDVNTSLIRFWEKEFALKTPKKTAKGNRMFTVKEIEHFNKIYDLVKIKGFTLDGAKKELNSKVKITSSETESSNLTNSKLIHKLEEIRSKLNRLKS